MIGISDSIDYLTSFNEMLGYLLGIWSCGLLFFIAVREKKVLLVRHIFWMLVLLFAFMQLFANGLYEDTLVQLGFNSVDMLGRLPLTFKEPSSAGFYVFCFTLGSIFLFQKRRNRIDLFYSFLGLAISFFLIASKAFYIYFAVFILCLTAYSLRDLNLKSIFYTATIALIGIYAFVMSDFYDLVIDLSNSFNDFTDLFYAANMSVSTRSFMLIEGISIIPTYPFGIGWGMVNDYLAFSLSKRSLIDNREVLGMAFTGNKISTKTYLIDFIIALGIPGMIFLYRNIRNIYTRFTYFISKSKIFFVILIPILFAGMIVEGFYFFFLLFYPFLVLIQSRKQRI
jgi:hypothetical protein